MMHENNLRFVGGDGMKHRRENDRAIVDEWMDWSEEDSTEVREGGLDERHAVSWGCNVLEVWMVSQLFQADGWTVRAAAQVGGEWERRLSVEKQGNWKLAREWGDTVRGMAGRWRRKQGRLGRWRKAAFEKGSVVMWKGWRDRVRVGRLDDWVEGGQTWERYIF